MSFRWPKIWLEGESVGFLKSFIVHALKFAKGFCCLSFLNLNLTFWYCKENRGTYTMRSACFLYLPTFFVKIFFRLKNVCGLAVHKNLSPTPWVRPVWITTLLGLEVHVTVGGFSTESLSDHT